MSKITNLVQQVRDYLVDPDHFVQYVQCEETDEDPRYCLAGAAAAVADHTLGLRNQFIWDSTDKARDAWEQLATDLGFTNGGTMAHYNNTHTHEEVMTLLDVNLMEVSA